MSPSDIHSGLAMILHNIDFPPVAKLSKASTWALDHDDGSLPFHRWTNGYLPLETIEKPSCPKVAGPKTIAKPLNTMVF